MKIVFHEKFYTSDYSWDPAASPGRLDGIMEIINKKMFVSLRKKVHNSKEQNCSCGLKDLDGNCY